MSESIAMSQDRDLIELIDIRVSAESFAGFYMERRIKIILIMSEKGIIELMISFKVNHIRR